MEAGTNALTIEEAAARLGVHYMTVYRYVRIGRLPAEYRDRRWQIDPADVDAFTKGPSRPRPRVRTANGGDRTAPATDRLLDRLLAGDGPGAWLIVENALLAGDPGDVYLDLLAPCLRTIGDRWAGGELTIADEHRATALALGLVGRLGPLFTRRGRRRPGAVLLAGAEGDSHAIPLLMVGDLLKAAGFNVIQLGADVPVPTLVAMAAAADLAAIGLSAGTDQGVANLSRAVIELHRRVPAVPVLVGGPAVTDEAAARRTGADGWAPDAASAVEAVTRLARPL